MLKTIKQINCQQDELGAETNPDDMQQQEDLEQCKTESLSNSDPSSGLIRLYLTKTGIVRKLGLVERKILRGPLGPQRTEGGSYKNFSLRRKIYRIPSGY